MFVLWLRLRYVNETFRAAADHTVKYVRVHAYSGRSFEVFCESPRGRHLLYPGALSHLLALPSFHAGLLGLLG